MGSFQKLKPAILLVAWVASVAYSQIESDATAWFVFDFLTCVLGYVLFVWMVGLKWLTVERTVSNVRVVAGQSIWVELTIRNRSWWPLAWVRVRDGVPQRLEQRPALQGRVVLFVWRKPVTLSYPIHQIPRGVHSFGQMEAEAGDAFGFFRRTRSYTVHDEIIAYPFPVSVPYQYRPQPVGKGTMQTSRRVTETANSVYGLRAYVPGDKLTRIHWGATARTGTLQTKEFEQSSSSGIVLYVDTTTPAFDEQDGYARFEWSLSIAAGLVTEWIAHRRPFQVVMSGTQIQVLPRDGQETNQLQVEECFARALPNTGAGHPHLEQLKSPIQQGNHIVLVSPSIADELAKAVSDTLRLQTIDWYVPCVSEKDLSFLEAQAETLGHRVFVHLVHVDDERSNWHAGRSGE